MILTNRHHFCGDISLESIGGLHWNVSIWAPIVANSGTLLIRRMQSNGSNAPVVGLRCIPIVPPVYINNMSDIVYVYFRHKFSEIIGIIKKISVYLQEI